MERGKCERVVTRCSCLLSGVERVTMISQLLHGRGGGGGERRLERKLQDEGGFHGSTNSLTSPHLWQTG